MSKKSDFLRTELDLDPYRQAILGKLAALDKPQYYDRIVSLIRGSEDVTRLAILSLLAEKRLSLVYVGSARRIAKWLAMPDQVSELPDILAVVGAQSGAKLTSFEQQRQAEQQRLQAMDAAQQERLQQYSQKRQAEFEQQEAAALGAIRQKWDMVERDSYDRLRYQLTKRPENERVLAQLRFKRDLAISKRDFYRNEYHRLLNREAPAWLLDNYAPKPEGLSSAIEELQK